jgi:ribosomal protein S18 acetylase RimI-like enzyme
MRFYWKFDDDGIVWEEVAELFRLAPLGVKDPKDIALAFSNSMFKCFVFEDDQMIGAGRALADGVNSAYLCDIAVHPDYQGLGIGKSVVNELLDMCSGHKKVILYANPGKEGFYRKMGFFPMTTAMAWFRDPEEAYEKGIISKE